MIRILEGSFIFMKQANGAVLQITGSPISEMESTLQQQSPEKSASRIKRFRIFYCNPLRVNSTVLMTLPRKRN